MRLCVLGSASTSQHTIVTQNRLCMQMGRLQASHQADKGVLQAALDSLQAQSRQLHHQHKRWAWQLAALLHWKRQGARQVRKLLHSWARLTAASRSRRAAAATASPRGMIRNSWEAARKGHKDDVSGAQICRKEHSLAEQSCCMAGADDQLEGPMPDGWAHHDRRTPGGCFRGTYACRMMVCAVLPAMLLMQLHEGAHHQQWCHAGKARPPRCSKRYPLHQQLQRGAEQHAVLPHACFVFDRHVQ